MSVMACNRYCCENILCDRTILNGRFYICNNCYAELEAWRKSWPATTQLCEVREKIQDFMQDMQPGSTSAVADDAIEAEFRRLTYG